MSFPIALHEPVAAIPAYLSANSAPVTTVAQVQAGLASTDVVGAFGAITGDVYAGPYAAAMIPVTGGARTTAKTVQRLFCCARRRVCVVSNDPFGSAKD